MASLISPAELGLAQSTSVNRFISRFMMDRLGLDSFNRLCEGVDPADGAGLAFHILEKLNISIALSQDSEPASVGSGAMVVANLPHGLLDIIVLIKILRESNTSAPLKFLANTPLSSITPFKEFAMGDGSESTFTLVRRAVDFVRQGGILVVFPSVKVAGYANSFPDIVDHDWHAAYMKIAKLAAAPIIPVFIYGRNSRKFLVTQVISDSVSRLRLVRELLNKEGVDVVLTIGQSIKYEEVSLDARRVADFVKMSLYLLREREQGVSVSQPKISLNVTTFDDLRPAELEYNVAEILDHGVVVSKLDNGTLYYVADFSGFGKRIFILDGGQITFSAIIHISNNTETSDRSAVHSKFASHRLFDFSHSKVSHIIDNCIELSEVVYDSKCVGGPSLQTVLEVVSKYFGVKYVISSASLMSDYHGNAYDIFVKYLSAHRLGGIFSRYIIPRGLSLRTLAHRSRGFLANHLAAIDDISTLSKLISKTENVDIEIDDLVRVMFDNGASVASVGIVKGENRTIISNILLVLEVKA